MIKRLFLLAASCLALAGVNQAWAEQVGTGSSEVRTGYEAKGISGTEWTLLYDDLQISRVTGIKGDLWVCHNSYTYPWYYKCSGPLDSVEGKDAGSDGVYNWVKDATAGTIVCEFQISWSGYVIGAVLTLRQGDETQGESANAIYAKVTKNCYIFTGTRYRGMSLSDSSVKNWNQYDGNLSTFDKANHSSWQGASSIQNVELEFSAEGLTYTVKFVDKDGNQIGEEQTIDYGKSATAPDTVSIPTVEGYKFAGWDKDFSNVTENMTVTAVYHKLYDVTFVDYYDQVLSKASVEETTAAVAPTDVPDVTIKEGEDDAGRRLVFNGTWDTDFSNITGAITVKANYNKIFKVTFLDSDGSQIGDVVEVEQGSSVADDAQPDMSGKSNFIGWDANLTNVQSDLSAKAIYGDLPSDVTYAQESGELAAEADALIWGGSSGDPWDAETKNWYTTAGRASAWQSGATAVFASDKTINLTSAQTVGKMIFLDKATKVVFTGSALTIAATATNTAYACTAIFSNDVTCAGAATFLTKQSETIDAVRTEGSEYTYIPTNAENAVVLFKNQSLEEFLSSDWKISICEKYGQYGASTNACGWGANGGNGIYHLKKVDDYYVMQCQFSKWGQKLCAKLALKQSGEDIIGWVESWAKLNKSPIGTDIDTIPDDLQACDYCYDDITKGKTAFHIQLLDPYMADGRGSEFGFAGVFNSDDDSEIYVGERVLVQVDGTFGTVDAANNTSTFGAYVVTENAVQAEPGVFCANSETPLTVTRCPLIVKSTYKDGLDGAKYGRFQVGEKETATFTAKSATTLSTNRTEYGALYIYGVASRAEDNSIPRRPHVREGGLFFSAKNWGYGYNLWVDKGGVFRLDAAHALAEWNANTFTIDGGTLTNAYEYSESEAKKVSSFMNMVLKNGAVVTGSRISGGNTTYYNGPYIECDGTSPSYVKCDELWMFNETKLSSRDTTDEFAQFRVNDVTGDEASDLIVTSPVIDKSITPKSAANVLKSGLHKSKAGTLELAGGATFTGVLKLEQGTVRFTNKDASFAVGLYLTGDGAIDFDGTASVSFGDSSAITWTAGKTLTLKSVVGSKSLRFGTDENGLTAEQLAQIKYADNIVVDKPSSFRLNSRGYLRYGTSQGCLIIIE